MSSETVALFMICLCMMGDTGVCLRSEFLLFKYAGACRVLFDLIGNTEPLNSKMITLDHFLECESENKRSKEQNSRSPPWRALLT